MSSSGPKESASPKAYLSFFADTLRFWTCDVEEHSCRDDMLTSSSDPSSLGILTSGQRNNFIVVYTT